MSLANSVNEIHERLDELQRRNQLLEHEHRSAKELGACQLRANKDTIRRLSSENTNLRSTISASSETRKPESMSDEAIRLKNKLNAIKSENARKERLIAQLQGQLLVADFSRQAPESTEEARQVRVIENRIDKAMIKFNEAQSIRKTYEGILHRLKEERISFDSQLRKLEEELAAKRKDFEELQLMSHDAMHAKEIAQAELHKFEQAVLEERNQRDREVMEKKLLVQQRLEMNQRTEQASQQAAGPIEPKNTVEREPTHQPTTDSKDALSELNKKIEEYEEAYARLREVTGVSDVNEIIQKFMTQTSTHQRLVTQTEEQEKQLEKLHSEYKKSKSQLDDLKFSSSSPVRVPLTNETSDAIVEDSALRLERSKTRFEKLAKLLVELNAGVSHLHAKLSPLKLEGRNPKEVSQVSEETIEDVLNLCELRIVRLVELVGHNPMPNEPHANIVVPKDIRIKLPDSRGEEVEFEDSQANDSIFNRTALKRSSEQFLEKVKKRIPIHA